MKILTKEEEQAHYYATLKSGTIGGLSGLAVGLVGVYAASARYHFVRQLTLPLKAFLVTSTGTFAGIVAADSGSRKFEEQRNPYDREYKERERERYEAERAGKSFTERSMQWGKDHRYQIVGGSWIASMVAAFALVNRNKYLSGPQKLVQARVYAQFLTLGVLVATAAFEISDQRNKEGKYEEVKYLDPNDPEHKRMLTKRVPQPEESDEGDTMWRDMIKAEEDRIKEREADEARFRKKHPHHDDKKATNDQKSNDQKSNDQKNKESGKREKNQAGKDSTPDNAPEQSEDEKKAETEKAKAQHKGKDEMDKEKDTKDMSQEEENKRAREGRSGYGSPKNEQKKDNAQDAPKGSSQSKGKVPSANDARNSTGEKTKDPNK